MGKNQVARQKALVFSIIQSVYIEERKKRKGVSGYLDFSLEKSTDFVMMKNSVKSFRVKAESK